MRVWYHRKNAGSLQQLSPSPITPPGTSWAQSQKQGDNVSQKTACFFHVVLKTVQRPESQSFGANCFLSACEPCSMCVWPTCFASSHHQRPSSFAATAHVRHPRGCWYQKDLLKDSAPTSSTSHHTCSASTNHAKDTDTQVEDK